MLGAQKGEYINVNNNIYQVQKSLSPEALKDLLPTLQAGGSGSDIATFIGNSNQLLSDTGSSDYYNRIIQGARKVDASSSPITETKDITQQTREVPAAPFVAPVVTPNQLQPQVQGRTLANISPQQGGITSLIDIWDSRPDLQKAFPNKGRELNDWWNKYGIREYPNVTLVAPGTTGIQDPRTLTVEAKQRRPEVQTPFAPINPTFSQAGTTTPDPAVAGLPPEYQQLYGQLKDYLGKLIARGESINPNVQITPELVSQFMAQAKQEIDPFFSKQIDIARQQFLTSLGYSKDQLLQHEQQLERQYGQQVRDIASTSAERGFAQSGIRQLEEQNLAQQTQQSINQARQALGFDVTSQAQQFAQQYGTSNLPSDSSLPSRFISSAPIVRTGSQTFSKPTSTLPLYDLSDNVYQGLIGIRQFEQTATEQQRASELEAAYRSQQALTNLRTLTL